MIISHTHPPDILVGRLMSDPASNTIEADIVVIHREMKNHLSWVTLIRETLSRLGSCSGSKGLGAATLGAYRFGAKPERPEKTDRPAGRPAKYRNVQARYQPRPRPAPPLLHRRRPAKAIPNRVSVYIDVAALADAPPGGRPARFDYGHVWVPSTSHSRASKK